MPSILQLVTIDSSERAVDSFVRSDAGPWQPVITIADRGLVALPSIDVHLTLAEMYHGTLLEM
jgi:hypothetical protein